MMLMIYYVYVVYILYIYWLKYFDMPTIIFRYVMYMLCIYYTYTDKQALPSGGAAIFTRSRPGCGTLDGPSLAWAASLWLRLRRSEGSPSTMLPNECGQQSGPWLSGDWYIHGIHMIYITYILAVSETYLLCTFNYCPVLPRCVHVFPILPTSIASL